MRTEAVRRIALLGGESSGKTTLAMALAAALHTHWVPEYGRELWEALRRTLTPDELDEVARVQVAREDSAAAEPAARASGWLVCDTSPLTTLQYGLHDHGRASAALMALSHRPYDLTVLCEPDFGFVQDGCRRDNAFRNAQHAWTLDRLAERGVVPLCARGGASERLAVVLAAVRRLDGRQRASAPVHLNTLPLDMP